MPPTGKNTSESFWQEHMQINSDHFNHFKCVSPVYQNCCRRHVTVMFELASNTVIVSYIHSKYSKETVHG